MLEIIAEGNLSRVEGRGAYMPSITPLGDGTLIACQHVGQGLGSPDNHIEVLRSSDGGVTWRNEGTIHDGAPPNDGWAYRGPEIQETSDGRLIITATRFEIGEGSLFDPDSEGLQRPETILLWSYDGGRNWSVPLVVPVDLPREKYTWNKAGNLMQLSFDRWMYPLETWKPRSFSGPPDQKSAAVFSSDQGETWGDFTVVADDPTGRILWWDQMNCRLPDGRIYTMFWSHSYGTSEDLVNHWVVSSDEGRTWSEPKPTNLRGQVCSPIPLPDGRVAAIYNYRHPPHGIRIAVTEDLSTFDLDEELTLFEAGVEATLGTPDHENFLAEHMLIGFGKPAGRLLDDGTLLTYFWCTTDGVSHTRWVRLAP
ncbi:MAG: sialidase family protein [Acidobacteria bacterium]|nr:sialidase family protein [Acidobacteriota bacterium]